MTALRVAVQPGLMALAEEIGAGYLSSAYKDVFAFVILGRGLRRLFVDGGDGVGACLGAGFEEVFGCAVGDVGFCGGFGDGVGAGAQGGDEGGLGGL